MSKQSKAKERPMSHPGHGSPGQINAKRAQREAINQQIEALKGQARTLSDEIRELEGPIPPREPGSKSGFTIGPA